MTIAELGQLVEVCRRQCVVADLDRSTLLRVETGWIFWGGNDS